MVKEIFLPLDDTAVLELHAGDKILLTGEIYVARDAAHKRIVSAIKNGGKPPFEIAEAAVYYAGPAPVKPGEIIGVIGPTTAGRMDAYTPFLLERGLRVMIGKGKRSAEVIEAMKKRKAVYLGAAGGAAVLLQSSVTEAETIAWPELGPEAVLRLKIKQMPLVVVIDCEGNSLYETGQAAAKKLIAETER